MTALVMVIGLIVGTLALVAQSRPQDLALQAARRSVAIGNLKNAIVQFKAVITNYPDDRPTTAAALLGLADCYRRLGDAESQKIYARIIADYADQRETVAVARARLAPGEPATDPVRRVWTVPEKAGIASSVSFDGRYISYVDWSDSGKGDLFLHSFG